MIKSHNYRPDNLDRLPPSSIDSEAAALGCCFLDPKTVMPICIDRFKEGGHEFYDLRHQTIYEKMLVLYDRDKTFDTITITVELKNCKMLDEVGGIAYVSVLPDSPPSASNIEYYIDIIIEKYLCRRTIQTCKDTVGWVSEYEGDVHNLLDKVERDMLAIRKGMAKTVKKTAQELVNHSIKTIEDMHQRQSPLIGISSGFVDYDKLTGGLVAGEMIVFAGRPSMGKTSLAMNIAEHVAVDQKLPVGVFSLEMTAEALMLRMLCSRARVNIRSVREGFLAERDFPKLTGAAGKLANAPLYIDDTGGVTIMQLRTKARQMFQEFGIKLLVIDYLTRVHGRAEKREREIAEISDGIKDLGKELNIPIIVLAQLNRELEREKNRKPRMADLRESGAIEADADQVGLLYKPARDDEDKSDYHSDAVPINLLIDKQRNGPAGEDVHFTFLKSYTRFESAAKISDEPNDYQQDMPI